MNTANITLLELIVAATILGNSDNDGVAPSPHHDSARTGESAPAREALPLRRAC